MDHHLGVYLPQDRRHAMAIGASLPERTQGAALFADIAGFTPLTEALEHLLGPRRGAEALAHQLNTIYEALITAVDRFSGSVVSFAGDAIICWFDATHGDAAAHALACALALHQAMHPFTALPLPNGTTTPLTLKVAVASGPVRRFLVGDPALQVFDALTGAPVVRMATAEQLAQPGEVVVDVATATALGDAARIAAWRTDPATAERFAVLAGLATRVEPCPWPSLAADALPIARLRSWLEPTVFERERVGHGAFLTEFRPAVVLFLRFTGLDYDADPAAGSTLDTFIRQVQAVLQRYAGTLFQLIFGDKGSYLYAGFGAPVAHEDDARRAVSAALDVRARTVTLGSFAPVQMGISQGTLWAGTYGATTRRTYGLHGDDVNLAARLMTQAQPGEILISGRVQQALRGEVALEPRPPVRVKGKAEPLPVFALSGPSQRRAIRLEEPTYALPMVGRAAELAVIAQQLALAVQGQGQVVGITAEAGIGKSRLVAEAIRLARRHGLQGYGGACQSSGTTTAYLVWQPIWRAFFDLDPGTPLRRQIRVLEGLVEEWAPARVAAVPLLGLVLNLPIPDNAFTQTLEPQFRKSALEALLLDCLRAAAREAQQDGAGLLFVLEDLHWIDPLSHDLLDQVARASAALPVLIVLAYRPPELVRLQAPRVEALPNFTPIVLRELASDDVAQVIRAKLAQLFPARGGAIPPALFARVTAEAQGNPFYVEELLNYLHDRGLDPHATAALQALELPSSLHRLILSRIDQLTTQQQFTLKAASIIGRLFHVTHLHGYYPALGTPEALKADLQELARLELTPLETPEPELAYLFKHIVTQEVTYESLAYTTRAVLHEQYAAKDLRQNNFDI